MRFVSQLQDADNRHEEGEVMARCERCGNEYGKPKKLKRFCSEACRAASENERRVRKEKYAYTCAYCGHEYRTSYKDRNTYCSRECAFDDRERRCDCGKSLRGSGKQRCEECQESYVPPPVFLKCNVCMSTYEKAGNAFQGCCSRECMLEQKRRNKYEYSKRRHQENLPQYACKECGIVFTPEYGSKRRTFCCELCSVRYSRREDKKGQARNHVERARRAGVAYERFGAREVLERDNWTCYICGQSTPKELRGTHGDNAPELDHVVPITRGGEHTRANVRCACRRCNNQKGTKMLSEMGR
jgi:5-methylcytosine-specific restriction endonuclease McrA